MIQWDRLPRVLALGVALSQLSGCVAPRQPTANARFEFEQPRMGVPFRIVLYAADQARAEAAASAAFARVAELNAILSDYETDSELSRLSRSSEQGAPWVPVSGELWTVLSAAQKIAGESDGAFDVTIGPCAALWRKARREQQFPEAARLENARAKVGFRNLRLDHGRARLIHPGMRLDLGGIAKGYAADQAMAALRAHGIRSALVAGSGDVRLGDPPPGREGWRVEIAGYDTPGGAAAATLLLANCAVATSGDLFQRLEINGVRYSHILDPFTCVGLTNHALATVIAPDGMTADMLATTCTIVPPERALPLASKYKSGARVIQLQANRPEVSANARFNTLLTKRLAGGPTSENHNAR